MPPNRRREDPGRVPPPLLVPGTSGSPTRPKLVRGRPRRPDPELGVPTRRWPPSRRQPQLRQRMGNRQTRGQPRLRRPHRGRDRHPAGHFIDHRSSRGRVVRLQEAEVGLQWTDDLDGAVEGLIDLWRSRLDRREFLAAMAATAVISEVALRWLVSPVDARVERDARARLVGPSDIDAVRAMQQSMKAIDDRHGGGVALPMAVEYLRGEVAPLLRARYTDTVGRALLSATSQFTLGVGWMAYDAGTGWPSATWRRRYGCRTRPTTGRLAAASSQR
jgi:hypothetical protein